MREITQFGFVEVTGARQSKLKHILFAFVLTFS